MLSIFLLCQKFLQLVKEMVIDEAKVDTLAKYATRNGKTIPAKYSDHNMLRLELELK